MADDLLESNIVIKTKVAQPNRDGFKTLYSDIELLHKKLVSLTTRPWTIKLLVDDSALKLYGLAKKAQPVSTGNSGGSSPVIPAESPAQSGTIQPRGTGPFPYYRRTTATDANTTLLEKTRQTVGGQKITNSVTTDETGAITKLVVEEVNLFEKAIQDRLKSNAASLKAERREQSNINSSKARLDRREASEYLKGALGDGGASRQDAAINASRTRLDRRQAGDYLRGTYNASSLGDLNSEFNKKLGEGFQQRPSTKIYNARTGEMSEIKNAVKVTGNAFTGYTAEVLKANEATKKMTTETLDHSRTIRYLGDSYANAASKVLLWSAATTTVFAATVAIKQAAVEVAKLEENTVLLARVGGSFAGGSDEFKLRYQAAKELTDQIIKLTTVYGGNAVEAQKAASIFARAGRDEKETLEATRVALIASRIAELDVEEAAKLLSGAMLQFNLSASQLLPTLDALNTLSNNYRVTTNDLLQSISRTGAVYAEHNGRLTELAAVTAVVAQTTSRSGSEIGNALKTISSNLDRVDTQTQLFKTLGVSTVDYAGESKSLGNVLFELKNNFEDLASSEEKHLTLQIAGVRQRNILVSAIKGADDALIAENKSLLLTGSASKEFYESSGTLIASLDRLRGALIQVANAGGGTLSNSFKGIIGILEAVARTLSVFNGLPARIIAAAGGFYLLYRAISVGVTALRAYVATIVGAITVQQLQTVVTVQQGAAMGLLARSTAAASLAAKGFIASGGLVTVGLSLAAVAAVNLYHAYDTYTESIEDSNIALQQSIDAEENKRKAFASTSSALLTLVNRYKELKNAGRDAEAAETLGRANRIGSSAGIKVSSGNFTQEDILKQQSDLQKASVKKEAELLQRQQNDNRKEFIKAYVNRAEARQRRSNVNERNTEGLIDIGLGYVFNPTESFSHGGRGAADIKATQQLTQAERDLQAVVEKRDATQKAILANKEKEVTNSKFDLDIKRAARTIQEQQLRAERTEANEKARRTVDEFDPQGSFTRLLQSHKEINSELIQQRGETERLVRIYEQTGQYQLEAEQSVKRQTDLLEKQREIEQQIYRAKYSASQKSAESLFGSRTKLLEGGGLASLETNRRLSDKSSFTDELANIDAKSRQQEERLRAAKRLADFTTGDNTPEGAGRLRAAQVEQQTAIVNLKSLEEGHALAIFEAEKNIAIERKKSADEALRAVGALTNEDKLRIESLAQYFSKNPNKKVSVEEQFAIDGSTGRTIGQYFPGRNQTLAEANTPFARTLRDSGFGQSSDLIKGQAEIAQYRRNRSDQDILNTTMSRLEELEKRHASGAGTPLTNNNQFNNAFGFGFGGGLNAGGGFDGAMNINLRGDSIDFAPLIASFENVAGVMMDQKIEHFAGEVRQIVREEQALGKRVLPNTVFPKNN